MIYVWKQIDEGDKCLIYPSYLQVTLAEQECEVEFTELLNKDGGSDAGLKEEWREEERENAWIYSLVFNY